MPIPSVQFCGACKYWVSTDSITGECHANAPITPSQFGDGANKLFMVVRPRTLAGDVACSSYIART